jgi:LCP family protein required for cell wall assembly
VDVEEKKAALVSFPRDTRVNIPGHGVQKINAARAYGGMEGAIEAVKDISGMEIHDYAEVDFAAFEKVVDAIGGVTLHLDYPILDPKIGALPAGDVFLNGEDSLVLVRSRDLPNGDLDRIDNQKKFLKAVMQKAVNVRDIQALLAILDAAVKYMETTIDPDMLFTLAEALGGMNVENVEFATLPGEDVEPATPAEPWYYVMDEDAAAGLFRNVNLYTSALSPEEQEAESARREQEETAEVDRSGVGLAVLNGAGWQGLAAGVAETMKARGYVDVSTGNTANPYERTTIYYAPGRETEARMVARDLDAEAEFVLTSDADVAARHDADVVLVLGEDYTGT